jgi:hypothetical protein
VFFAARQGKDVDIGLQFERLNQDLQLDLASERKLVIELRRSLDERSLDLNLPELRKRDSQVSVSSRVSRLSNGRDESSNLRDQITGLKCAHDGQQDKLYG